MQRPFIKTLKNYGRKEYSQTMEAGILEGIFENIGVVNKYFVEFGAWDGKNLSNTANLRLNHAWTGLLLEGDKEKAKEFQHITHGFVTAENVNLLFEKHNVPSEFDLLSIDIDGNDYWVWKAIDEKRFCPRVVVIEYNCNIPNQHDSIAIKYSPEIDTTKPSIYYYSASIPALKKLGESKGYSLVYRVNLHNLFFIRTELLHPDDRNIPVEMFLNKDGKAYPHPYMKPYKKPDPHWNEYADTEITIFWEQDFNREWVRV